MLRSAGFAASDLTERFSVAPEVAQWHDPAGWLQLAENNRVELLAAFDDDRLQQATLWQEPAVVAEVIPRAYSPKPARARRHQPMLARYLQRYLLRNESIGFFGPVVWGSLGSGGAAITRCPPDGDPVRTECVVESWAVQALAEALVADTGLRQQFPATLYADVWMVGSYAVRAGHRRRLTPVEATLVAELRGPAFARLRPSELAEVTGVSRDEALTALADLADADLLHWGPDRPPHVGEFGAVREQLSRLEPSPQREHALTAIDAVAAAVAAAQRARSAPELRQRLDELGDLFESITGSQSRRDITGVERGRQLVALMGERRDVIRIGGQLADDITALVRLLLPAARWLVHSAGVAVESRSREVVRAGDGEVPLGRVFAALAAVVWTPDFMAPIEREFTVRWERLWQQGGTSDDQALDDVAARVRDEFEAPLPSWASGAEHSPDMLVAARDIAAANRGEYRLVLGEVHVGTVTSDQVPFCWSGDGRARIEHEYARTRSGAPRWVPAYPNDSMHTSSLNFPPPDVGDGAHQISLIPGPLHDTRTSDETRTVRISDCVVREEGGALRVATPIGELDLLQVLGELASQAASSAFQPFAPGGGRRRTLDNRIVLSRASWTLATAEAQALVDDDPRRSCVRVRERLERMGVPRWTFWRAVPGAKPMFLDLWNALYVRQLVRTLRRLDPEEVSRVVLVEMEPDPHHLWLPHPEGAGVVTSELRVTVTDR